MKEILTESYSKEIEGYLQPLLMKSRISKEVRETIFTNPIVHIACDTRGSSKRLVAAVKEGLGCFGVESIDHGLLSTPQLHYMTANN